MEQKKNFFSVKKDEKNRFVRIIFNQNEENALRMSWEEATRLLGSCSLELIIKVCHYVPDPPQNKEDYAYVSRHGTTAVFAKLEEESVANEQEMKTVYTLVRNGWTKYYRTKSSRDSDYVSQDSTSEMKVSPEEYERYSFEEDK